MEMEMQTEGNVMTVFPSLRRAAYACREAAQEAERKEEAERIKENRKAILEALEEARIDSYRIEWHKDEAFIDDLIIARVENYQDPHHYHFEITAVCPTCDEDFTVKAWNAQSIASVAAKCYDWYGEHICPDTEEIVTHSMTSGEAAHVLMHDIVDQINKSAGITSDARLMTIIALSLLGIEEAIWGNA